MNQLFANRYVQLALLAIGIGLVFWIIIWAILRVVGIADFPVLLQLGVAFLGAGLLVARFFAGRVF